MSKTNCILSIGTNFSFTTSSSLILMTHLLKFELQIIYNFSLPLSPKKRKEKRKQQIQTLDTESINFRTIYTNTREKPTDDSRYLQCQTQQPQENHKTNTVKTRL